MPRIDDVADFPVDLDTGAIRAGRVLVQRVPGATLFMSLGPAPQSSDFADRFIARCQKLSTALDQGLFKAGYDPSERREGSGSQHPSWWEAASDHVETLEEINRKKENFVAQHLADAQKVADRLGVPVENILGLTALEGGWGIFHFAREGNNFFGMQYPDPARLAIPGKFVVAARNKNARLAQFKDYATCLESFVITYGHLIQGVQDPKTFAEILQNTGAFGINTTTHKKIPEYPDQVAKTIRGLRPLIKKLKQKL